MNDSALVANDNSSFLLVRRVPQSRVLMLSLFLHRAHVACLATNSEHPYSFVLYTSSDSYVLSASSDALRTKWL